MLELLREQAYHEIRAGVDIAVKTLLPADLLEVVVDHALIADGVPVDWRTHTTNASGQRVVADAYRCDWMRAQGLFI